MSAGALGCSGSRALRPLGVRLGWRPSAPSRCGRRWWIGLLESRPEVRLVDLGHRLSGCAIGGHLMSELRYLSLRGGAPPLTLSEAIRQGWRSTAACMCRRGFPGSMSQRWPARCACPTSRSARSTGSSRAIGWRRRLRISRGWRSISRRRRRRSRSVEIRCSCSSSSTDRSRRSRISARDFWPSCFVRIRNPDGTLITILVTSSVTPAARLRRPFTWRPWVRVVIFYPKGPGERPS